MKLLNLSFDWSLNVLIPLNTNDLKLALSVDVVELFVVMGLAIAVTLALTKSPTVLAAWLVMLVALNRAWTCGDELDENGVAGVVEDIGSCGNIGVELTECGCLLFYK